MANTKLWAFGFVFIAGFAQAQNFPNGLILPSNENDSDVCCVYVPQEGLTVYDGPNGKNIGKITRNVEVNTGNQAPYRVFFLNNISNETGAIDLSLLEQIGYDVWCMRYFKRQNGYVRVLDDSVGYWLSEQEINRSGFEVVEWQKFLIDHEGLLLGYYAKPSSGLNLREKPTTRSKVIKKLEGELFEISPTNENIGLWTKVKVKKYKEHPCESSLSETEIVEYELEGWIKMVDDDGLPNVWFYPGGC